MGPGRCGHGRILLSPYVDSGPLRGAPDGLLRRPAAIDDPLPHDVVLQPVRAGQRGVGRIGDTIDRQVGALHSCPLRLPSLGSARSVLSTPVRHLDDPEGLLDASASLESLAIRDLLDAVDAAGLSLALVPLAAREELELDRLGWGDVPLSAFRRDQVIPPLPSRVPLVDRGRRQAGLGGEGNEVRVRDTLDGVRPVPLPPPTPWRSLERLLGLHPGLAAEPDRAQRDDRSYLVVLETLREAAVAAAVRHVLKPELAARTSSGSRRGACPAIRASHQEARGLRAGRHGFSGAADSASREPALPEVQQAPGVVSV